jgi:hypothetical protein
VVLKLWEVAKGPNHAILDGVFRLLVIVKNANCQGMQQPAMARK